ncbi:MAG TPA: MlaA family lipoprotein, partial [Stellaceae bacterium]|nr:MlaA family lipoprotein [Stellaceae bacterium]
MTISAARRSLVAGRCVAVWWALALVLSPNLAMAAGEVDIGTQPGLATRLGAIAGALCDTAERDLVTPSRQAAEAVLTHPRTQQLWGQVSDAAQSLGASANTHILQPLSRESAELFTRSGLRQSYQRFSALVGGLLETLRLSILDPLISSLQRSAERVTAPAPAAARPRLATAADPPAPAMVIPGLPESDILRNLKGEDPLEAFNRLMFGLNGGLQANLLGPVSELYTEDTPAELQLGIGNFFRNLR